MDIKFKLNLNMKNLNSNSIKKFSKVITKKNINLEKNLKFLLDNEVITSYFNPLINKHCKNSDITRDALIVDSYSVESKTPDVAIFFNTEDIDRYSCKPSIYAISSSYEEELKLFCEQIDNFTIKWFWKKSDKETHLLDENNHIIKRVPPGVNYFIETNLISNKTYSRKVNVDGIESLMCSITIKDGKKTSIYDSFSIQDRQEDIKTNDDVYSSRLKAFSSGVGDGLSCKLFKQVDTDYGKSFRIINKIYGVRASEIIKHHTIQFKYRYKMIGIVDYPSYRGSAKVNISATPVSEDGVVIGTKISSSKALEYSFDTDSQIADVYIKDSITTLAKNYSTKYKIEVTISDIYGDLEIFSHEQGYRKNLFNGSQTIRFTEYGYYDYKFSISSKMIIKSKEVIEYYPPKVYEPLVGIVNGDFEVTESGKKDMLSSAYIFSPADSVYNKRYYCEIEEVKPSSSYVKYKFDGELEQNDYTLVNGDSIKFSSDAIVENDTEYKDFLAQVEIGEFYINDSKKHIYEYSINDITANQDRYKRFELIVSGSTSDIGVLEYNKDLDVDSNGKINTKIKVVIRAVQSAIAKWEPLIHSGYYYYNQEERFLYTNCMMNGEDKILDNVFVKYPISMKVIVTASDNPGPIEIYDISKISKDDLWTDRTLYFWYRNKIWPRPISVSGNYYDFLEEYVYETEPFLFNKRPTSIDSITWDQVCTANNSIDVYVVVYNEAFGKWNEPVKIEHNLPLPTNITYSKILKLRYVLKPSRMPNLIVSANLFSCENHWNSYADKYLSENIYYQEERLEAKSNKTIGNYISTILDLGDTVLKEKQRSITFKLSSTGNVNIYIQHSNSKEELEDRLDNSTWTKVNESTAFINLDRYCRFKIELIGGAKIHNMNLFLSRYEYNTDYDSFMPSFGNIRVKAHYNPVESKNIYEQITARNLEFDGKEHVVIPNLYEFIENMSKSQKFEINNMVGYSISSYGALKDDFSIRYNQNLLTNESVYVQGRDIKYDLDLMRKNQNGVIFDVLDDTIEVFPIPQQYSPVIITEEHEMSGNVTSNDAEPLTNVFFMDDDGEISLFNEEHFESLGFKTLYLKHQDIDESSIVVKVNGVQFKDYRVVQNVVEFKTKIPKGYSISVRYMLKNSYCVKYDYEDDKAIISFNKGLGMKFKKVRVFYETNKESSIKKIDNINLNPIYNLSYNGYIYICDYTLEPHSMSIYPASNSIYANGKDDMIVIITVRDKNNNPIENVDINVVCAYGKITKINEVTDSNGIVPCLYTSSEINCIDTIKAIASANVKATANITNRVL